MNDDSLEVIERQLTAVLSSGAPPELRGAVLADVQRELRAARWDRRLTRAAALLLVVGVGLNVAIGLRSTGSREAAPQQMARSNSRQSLVDTAVVVAEATDAATGSRFARQLAAMSGRELTADEAAAIEAAVRRAVKNGNRG
jgi:hypothetical protein